MFTRNYEFYNQNQRILTNITYGGYPYLERIFFATGGVLRYKNETIAPCKCTKFQHKMLWHVSTQRSLSYLRQLPFWLLTEQVLVLRTARQNRCLFWVGLSSLTLIEKCLPLILLLQKVHLNYYEYMLLYFRSVGILTYVTKSNYK